ncbi:hypothetical protein V1517DRAFT_74383 [Lipomyces orientalis]|uniref:Uncharacterized protein n=1 Tax=Lipomyces orientalis TaxID=1233043 RepID=A0ACC3TTF4_9ASCO
MPAFKLLRSKKSKLSKHDQDKSYEEDTPRSQQPTITQVVYRNSEDEDGGILKRRSNSYSFCDSESIPRGGLISLIPSSLPDDDIKSQLNDSLPPGHRRRKSNVTFSDWDQYDDGSTSKGRTAEELAAKLDNVNTRQGAQRRTAMATYRTTSYEEYEQRAIVDESYRTSTSSPAARSDLEVISEDEEFRRRIDALNIKDTTASRGDQIVILPFKRDESISPLDVTDSAVHMSLDDASRQSTSSMDEATVLPRLPQRARNVESRKSVISELSTNVDNDSALNAAEAPVVMSVDHHPGESPPPKSQSGAYVHYPAPIPARIRLPPLLKKKSKSSNPSETSSPATPGAPGLSTSFTFPMTAPMDKPDPSDNGSANDEHSDSEESTVPVTPGYMPKFQNPHQALESILSEWDKEPTSLVQPFTPQEELPVTDGPRSLIQELEERKSQQKSRQRNAAAVNSASLLQLDDVIRKGQEKRRTVVSAHGLVGTAQMRNDEDELPLGAIYSNEPKSQRGEPTRVPEGRRYSHSPSNSLALQYAVAHNRRTSSSSIPQRSMHDRQLSDSSAQFVPPSKNRGESWQSNLTSGTLQGAILPEDPNSLNRIRERDVSMPNLHYQLNGKFPLNMPPEPSLYTVPAREMSVPNFDQYRQSPGRYSAQASNLPQYPPHQQQNTASQHYSVQYQRPQYPGQAPANDMGTGYFRESIDASGNVAMNNSGTGRQSSLLNSEEALYRRLKERESIMMGFPPQKPGPRAVSMMTREGYELLLQKQYYQQQQSHTAQQYYSQNTSRLPAQEQSYIPPGIQQSNSRPTNLAALGGSAAPSNDSKKREVVERWRRSVYTGGT